MPRSTESPGTSLPFPADSERSRSSQGTEKTGQGDSNHCSRPEARAEEKARLSRTHASVPGSCALSTPGKWGSAGKKGREGDGGRERKKIKVPLYSPTPPIFLPPRGDNCYQHSWFLFPHSFTYIRQIIRCRMNWVLFSCRHFYEKTRDTFCSSFSQECKSAWCSGGPGLPGVRSTERKPYRAGGCILSSCFSST